MHNFKKNFNVSTRDSGDEFNIDIRQFSVISNTADGTLFPSVATVVTVKFNDEGTIPSDTGQGFSVKSLLDKESNEGNVKAAKLAFERALRDFPWNLLYAERVDLWTAFLANVR